MNEQGTHTDLFVNHCNAFDGSLAPAEKLASPNVAVHKSRRQGSQAHSKLSQALAFLLRSLPLPVFARRADRVCQSRRDCADELLAQQDEVLLIAAALAQLPERTRVAFEMHRLGGHTLQQIAAELDITAGMAHQLIRTALSRCAAALDVKPDLATKP